MRERRGRECGPAVPVMALALAAVLLGGSLAAARAQEVYGPPPAERAFGDESVFIGIARKGEVLIALYLRDQRWEDGRLVVRAVLVPMPAFSFERGYRGFQKIDHVRIRRNEGLRLAYEAGSANFALRTRVDLADTLPVAVEFVSRDRRNDFLPDPIRQVDFRVGEVARWEKVAHKDMPRWSRNFEDLDARGRRAKGPLSRKTGGRGNAAARPPPGGGDDAGYRGRWATLNGTYIFEKKTVYSPIVRVLEVGEFVERTKPAGGGWMEVIYGEEEEKGYVPAVFLVDDEAEATRWEEEKDIHPVSPPLEPAVAEGDSAGPGEPGDP